MKYRVKRHTVCQPPDQSYRLIPLTQGQNAIVDAADFEWLSQWNWSASWNPGTESFYVVRRNEFGRFIRMHREILQCEPNEDGDHKNHDTLDNRRENLRRASPSQNGFNSRLRSDNASGIVGVHWNTRDRKWIARINCNGKEIHLGSFDSLHEATDARDKAAKRLHGEFAHLNL